MDEPEQQLWFYPLPLWAERLAKQSFTRKKTHTQNTCKFLSIFSFFLKTKKKKKLMTFRHTQNWFSTQRTLLSHTVFWIGWYNHITIDLLHNLLNQRNALFVLFLWILIETNILIHLNDLEHKNFAQCFFFLRRLIVSNFGSLQFVHS